MERHLALIAGEASGDVLGEHLMRGLQAASEGRVRFSGLGGERMSRQGLESLFPIEEISIVGLGQILRGLPRLVGRLRETAAFVERLKPDALVIIDSPEFTHRVARRVKKRLPSLPIVNYAPPQVWAWRGGRARRMRSYIDKALCLLPFEPEAYKKLGGPESIYVGHPAAAERAGGGLSFRKRHGIKEDAPLLLIAPGSRDREIRCMAGPFMEAAGLLEKRIEGLRVGVAVAPGKREAFLKEAARGGESVLLVESADRKGLRSAADAALCASGTMTLELGLAGTPFVCAYGAGRADELLFRALISVEHFCLVNIIVGRRAVPEHLGRRSLVAEVLAKDVSVLFGDTPERRAQEQALCELGERMETGEEPGLKAAREVLKVC